MYWAQSIWWLLPLKVSSIPFGDFQLSKRLVHRGNFVLYFVISWNSGFADTPNNKRQSRSKSTVAVVSKPKGRWIIEQFIVQLSWWYRGILRNRRPFWVILPLHPLMWYSFLFSETTRATTDKKIISYAITIRGFWKAFMTYDTAWQRNKGAQYDCDFYHREFHGIWSPWESI